MAVAFSREQVDMMLKNGGPCGETLVVLPQSEYEGLVEGATYKPEAVTPPSGLEAAVQEAKRRAVAGWSEYIGGLREAAALRAQAVPPWAAAEAELEAAVDSGRIRSYGHCRFNVGGHRYDVDRGSMFAVEICTAALREEAAALAAAFVRELPQAPRRTEVTVDVKIGEAELPQPSGVWFNVVGCRAKVYRGLLLLEKNQFVTLVDPAVGRVVATYPWSGIGRDMGLGFAEGVADEWLAEHGDRDEGEEELPPGYALGVNFVEGYGSWKMTEVGAARWLRERGETR